MIAVFKKQLADTLKNKTVLIQFVMFPILIVFMNHSVQIEGMPDNFFVCLFATMYIGMAPLTSMAAIVSEEKEKNTLKVLMMSNVKPAEYLLGVGGYTWLLCMIGAAVFCLEGKYSGKEAVIFMGIMAIGIFCSLLIGAAIGTWSSDQMTATSITVPVMMIFSFLPMLSMFNEKIEKVAKFTYSEQISILIGQIKNWEPDAVNILVIISNIAVAALFFTFSYRKCGLSG